MKIKVQALTILLSVIFLVIYINVPAISEEALQEHKCEVESIEKIEKEIVEKKSLSELPELYMDGAEVAYDKESNTIYLPQNMDEPSLKMSFSTKGYMPVIAETERLDSLETAIAEGTRFDFYLIGEDKYFEAGVVFTGMPVMRITTQVENLKVEDEADGTNYKGTMTVFDQYESYGEPQIVDCSYHIRGAASREALKKNYRLEIEDTKSLLGLRENDSWVLDSLHDDEGLVHNMVSMRLWNKMAQYNSADDNGVNGEYLELIINNEYRGVYQLIESPGAESFAVGEEDVLYKATVANRDTFEELYPKKKKTFTADAYAIDKWKRLFCVDEIPDYEDGTSILNMENAADLEIFCLLLSAWDNGLNNLYFLADYQSDGNFQFIKIPWDMENTFGMSGSIGHDKTLCDNVDLAWTLDMKKLYQANPKAIGTLLYDRWQELRSSGVITEEVLDEMFDEEYAYLYNSGAYARNYEKWGYINDQWDDSYVYDFVEKRIPFLDKFFKEISEGGVEIWTTDTN